MNVGTAAELIIVPIAPTGGGTRITQSKEENGDDNDIAMHQPIFWIAGGNSSPSKFNLYDCWRQLLAFVWLNFL